MASESSDEQLVAAIARGDQAAFGEFYDRHSPRVFGLLQRILRSPRDAEDVLQEAFWHIWSRADDFDASRGKPVGWLLLIARSRAVDCHRRLVKTAPTASDEVSTATTGGDASTHAEVAEQSERVRRALAGLPDEQRTAIQACFFDGLTHRELADQEDLPLGTVKTRIRLGMSKLRDRVISREKVHGEAARS